MTSEVALGAAMRNNLLSLQKTNSLLEMTQLRLATGRKVNSALDNPLSFFTAQSLTNRSSDLSRLLDSMGQSISTIKEADKGVTSLTKLLEQAQATVSDAQDTLAGGVGASFNGTVNLKGVTMGTLGIADGQQFRISVGGVTTANITANTADTGETLVTEINAAFTTAGIEATASLDDAGRLKIEAKDATASVRLLGGTTSMTVADFTALGFGSYVEAQADGAGGSVVGGTIVGGSSLKSAALLGVKGTDTVDNTFAAIASGQTLTFGITINGTDTINVTVDETMTIDELVTAINEHANNRGRVAASFSEGSGQITLSMNSSVDTIELAQTPSAAGSSTSFGFGAGLSDLQTTDNAISEELITFKENDTLDKLKTLEDNYNELRSQIDALVEDASYRGINLLAGDTLTTYFNEDRSNKLVTVGKNLTSAGLGLDAADFGSLASATDADAQVRSALNAARDFGTQLANSLAVLQTREDFTKETMQVLEEGADKLTLADPNEEGARMLALQTRLQLGVTSLSLAAQSQQSVLSLF